MPPKNASGNTTSAPQKPSKKTEQKKKEKVIEDKTFGLKNKKGAKQQKFIQQVEKQVKFGGNPSNRKLELEKLKEKEKKAGDGTDDITSTLFKPVTAAQKVEKGADPKSVLCAFFKQGQCGKGEKCKFSHDLTIERKAEKRSLYCDLRDDGTPDTMDQWDEEKLKEVIEKKHGEADRSRPQTDIICKFFLDAVEKSKYGWFWECPNGSDCHYRHALPPGFMLKKDKVKLMKDEISLEDLVERERAALSSGNLTKVTLVSFIAWKKRKISEKKETLRKDEDKKRVDFKAGRHVGLSGREMFTFNPAMAVDELEDGDDAFDTGNLSNDEDEEENEYKEIAFDQAWEEEEEDGSGTTATNDRFAQLQADSAAAMLNLVAIDEDLFNEDELPDDEDDDEED